MVAAPTFEDTDFSFMPEGKDRLREYAVIALSCLIFLAIALPFLAQPGLEHDETHFCNGAMGLNFNVFRWYEVNVFGATIPLMAQNQAGLAKSLIYFPIFSAFPVDVALVRLPTLIVGCLTIPIVYALTRALAGPATACATILMYATDPNIIFNFRMDWGPSAVGMVCKLLLLAFFIKLIRSPSPFVSFLAGLVCGFAFWDKLSFVWPVAGLAIAGLLVYWASIKSLWRWRLILPAVLGLGLGGLPLWIYNFPIPKSLITGLLWKNPPFPLPEKVATMFGTLDGSALYEVINGQPPWFPPLHSFAGEALELSQSLKNSVASTHAAPHSAFAILALSGSVVTLILSFIKRDRRNMSFVSILTALLIVGILLTSQTYGPHHFVMLYPLIQIVVAYPLVALFVHAKSFAQPKKVMLAGVAALLLALTIGGNCYADFRYVDEYRSFGGRSVWSDAIYELSDHVKGHSDKYYAVIDWGIFSPLIPLCGKHLKGSEYVFLILNASNEKESDAIFSKLLDRDDVVFVLHSPEATQLHKPTKLFYDFVAKHNLKVRQTLTINQKDGLPLFVLVEKE